MRTGRLFWVTFFPAMFMTAVCTSYILVAPEGLAINYTLGVAIGVVAALVTGIAFLIRHYREKQVSTSDNA
jgi:branched-subunit amino acid transport protein